jgi:hypothetical protein
MTDCYLCGDPIERPGKQRAMYRATGETAKIHQRCRIPNSPVTRIAETDTDDHVTVTVDGTTVAGQVAGTGMTHTPARGRYLFVEAAQFDGLPTDRVMIIHRYRNGSFQDVHAYVDAEPFETGGWEDIGEVDSLEVTADE